MRPPQSELERPSGPRRGASRRGASAASISHQRQTRSFPVGEIGDDETGDKASRGETAPVGSLLNRADISVRAASADLAVARTVSSPPCVRLNPIG